MDRNERVDLASRRNVLKGAGAVTIAGGFAARTVAQDVHTQGDVTYSLRQGDSCTEITPLAGTENIVDLYGYTEDLSGQRSNLPSQFERAQTSRLFLYDGPEGLSLGMVHGGDDDPGGAVTSLICGLPNGGDWVVLDDSYQGARDEFQLARREAVLNWAWGSSGRNDGAVFRGFPRQFHLSIDSAFNEAAKLDPFGSGDGVTDWQFLSGDFEEPDVIGLDMDEPVDIHTGACGRSGRSVMSTKTVDEPFGVEVTLCCKAVLVESEAFDWVRLNYLDGTDQQFDGPFEGANGFLADDDNDNNPNDEIIQSVGIGSGGDRVEVENPNFDRCLDMVDEEEDEEYYGNGGS